MCLFAKLWRNSAFRFSNTIAYPCKKQSVISDAAFRLSKITFSVRSSRS